MRKEQIEPIANALSNRCATHWILALAFFILFLANAACRFEIGLEKAIAAANDPPTAPIIPATAVTVTKAPTIKEIITVEPTATITPGPTARPTTTDEPPLAVPASQPPDRIIARAIDLDAPVSQANWKIIEKDGKQDSSWVIPDDAAGWHANSSLPGHGGNIVISGHHNLGTEVFRNLVELKKGDEVILKADGRDYHYLVTDAFILPDRDISEEQHRQNGSWILPTKAERLTLITCWPYNDNSHRVIILAKPSL